MCKYFRIVKYVIKTSQFYILKQQYLKVILNKMLTRFSNIFLKYFKIIIS